MKLSYVCFLALGSFAEAICRGSCKLSVDASDLAADTCTINSGQKGECILTSTCSSQGGTSQVGHCPGAADIQCCTYGSCTVNGEEGTCQPTGTCSGTKTAGHCPGPSDIQCCTSSKGGCTAPSVNAATISLIKSFEGFVASPGSDPIGLPTVGYGHLCETKGCAEVPYPFPLTTTTASELLASDLKKFEQCVSEDIDSSIHLNANQYGALVSWAYNVGCDNVASSTLIKRLNAKDTPDTVASEELPKWDMAGGQVEPGLQRRRAAEVKLFETASGVAALPAC
ncbi:lysozyme-like protein [Mollisia scopiformis]|uniref:Lysozyme-like protein n=1 Tax=Mollisia scopiformis TaxID=149040 RepID=A0A194XFQ9_MOLSC|nr:lysozyme-like protein [Mollisia scopiformis]KUJ19003.1 lysozyme-like protein [Mollisia scopiformis]